MKLNIGCGFDKRDGWLDVDGFPECEPDQPLDIDAVPWNAAREFRVKLRAVKG